MKRQKLVNVNKEEHMLGWDNDYYDYINAIMVLTRTQKNSCIPPTPLMMLRYYHTDEKILTIAQEDWQRGIIKDDIF